MIQQMERAETIQGIPILTAVLSDTDPDTLRSLIDLYRQRNPTGVAVLASLDEKGKPIIISGVTEDLIERGLHAGELVKFVAQPIGGDGGGRPTLAQAGGKDASKLEEALAGVAGWVENKLKS